jgi:DnaJ-class molecular chaperone
MNERTYYMILGVSRTESTGGIRSAYRDLAKKLHPDIAGQQATHAFQEITEAYDVLSDPRRRRAYNDELRRAESKAVMPPPPVEPVRAPVSILVDAEAIRPSFDETYDRFLGDFSGIGVPRSDHVEGLNVEVVLTPEEGRRGCALPIGVPAFHRCRQCGGSGREWLFPCLTCRQLGMIEREEIVRVRIPPMAPSGSIFEIPLRGSGIHDFCLRLHVFVEPQVANERR